MLYLNHDFYSNFNSGVNSGDNELVSDMIVNELSELIIYKNSELFDTFKKAGIKINEKASDEKIVDVIINNISKNINLTKRLAFLIASNNNHRKTLKTVTGKDGNKREVTTKERTANRSEIYMIESGIMGIGDSFTYKPQLKKEFKLKMMKVIKTKSKAVGDRERKHTESNNGKYWLLAFLVVGAGVGAYFYLKHRKKVAAEGLLVDGVEVDNILPTPPPPVPTPPVETVAPVVENIPTPDVPTPHQVIVETPPITEIAV